jgi:hypothetical protein
MAPDQRYCLECGMRRGDPRLPFMDAVVFMDAVRQPAPVATPTKAPEPKREKRVPISANASLIAGVGTLLLALGIGVLIGKTDEGGATNASAAPSVIRVGGGAETASAASGSEAGGKGGAKTTGEAGGKGGTNKAKSKEGLSTDSSGTTKAAAEVLKPSGDVTLPPPTVQKGGSCEAGAAGCDGGEFTGEFFGE